MQGGVRARAGREAGGSKLARANNPNEFRELGLLKVRLSPSNVAGEKKLHLPEGSKASFGGVFPPVSPAPLRLFCLFVCGGGKKKNPTYM